MTKAFNFRDAVAGTVFDEGRALDVFATDATKFIDDLSTLLQALAGEEIEVEDDVIEHVAFVMGDVYEALLDERKDEQAEDIARAVRGIVGGAFGGNEEIQKEFALEIESTLDGDSSLEIWLQKYLTNSSDDFSKTLRDISEDFRL